MTSATIERLEITEVREAVAPGDDDTFVMVHGVRETGCYGPISEQIAAYARDTLASEVKGPMPLITAACWTGSVRPLAPHPALSPRGRSAQSTARPGISSGASPLALSPTSSHPG